ncbi:phosphonate metabolism protein/1,5-bisphosphokinase (PRPP-forming) PhnN [uncultured Cohaesibacter sp.]|uniref:phosphonate metabolism protein/1,5-bisphosphokinase (PRPP-forming) PhnN n=1 Tax=uncultured Cohaesibacter sp. TaxID=1002546 RepID=UPI0029C6B6C9|nr:phosphonate metabolism protein/1,5-bisphosphokinase (PRPP-forming) PhnN [uncultured Cohaesibacter sp.]
MLDRAGAQEAKIKTGTLLLLVGPSGSGKDSLLNWAREKLKDDPRVLFVRRSITREKGDPSEDHQSMTVDAFQQADSRGEFVISWGAHGLFYGLPVSLLDHLQEGGVAVANGSRKTIPELRERFANLSVVNLTVKPDILARRLAARGRESEEEITERLQRTAKLKQDSLFGDETRHIDNSGALKEAGSAFVELILTLANHEA